MYSDCKKAPGTEYIIENGNTEYVIENYDKSICNEKIDYIVSNRDRFSENSKSRIENNFLWSAICNKYEDLFNKLKWFIGGENRCMNLV